MNAWEKEGKETDSLRSITAEDSLHLKWVTLKYLMFVKLVSIQSTHITNAVHTPLSKINDYLDNYKAEETSYIHCAGGYRSVIAASILKSRGIHNITDVKGGFGAIKKTNVSISDYVCPSTL